MCQVAFLLFFFYLKKGIEINFGYFFFKENEYNLFYLANKKKIDLVITAVFFKQKCFTQQEANKSEHDFLVIYLIVFVRYLFI